MSTHKLFMLLWRSATIHMHCHLTLGGLPVRLYVWTNGAEGKLVQKAIVIHKTHRKISLLPVVHLLCNRHISQAVCPLRRARHVTPNAADTALAEKPQT